MPGLSFLFKKKWHPSRKDNQEKVFIKEQTSIYDKSKEEEAAREVAKEAELQSYVRGGDIGDRDPRTSSLKFMYAQPTKSGDASSSSSISMEPQKPQVGEDEDVKRFWKKLKGDFKHEDDAFDVKMAESREFSSTNATSSSKTFRTQSALEKQVGKKTGELLNRSELEARHPRLKNAPVEGGAYTAQMHLNHKPFLDVIRNVRCLRCGEWGHALGDRECSLLHEVSAHDLARQRQEDPVNAMRREEVIEQKQRLVLRQALACPQNKERATYYGGQADNQQLLSSEEEGESDPEGAFLATLTRREKKLLLKRLKAEEEGRSNGGVKETADHNSGNSDSSDEGSSSSSSSSSSSASGNHRKRKRQRKLKKLKSSKKRKH